VAPGVLLFPGTALAAAAIALLNLLLPSLVKRRAPERAGLLIGLYLLSLSAGSILASLIAVRSTTPPAARCRCPWPCGRCPRWPPRWPGCRS